VGKLFFIGLNREGKFTVYNRTLQRVMGIAGDDQAFWLATLYQIWRFQNSLQPGQVHEGYDRCYVPQMSYVTGDVDVHDIGITKDGSPVFISTLFSCLARPSTRYSFEPVWRPPFISRLAAEDRCHLNGLAMVEGEPAFVTAVSETDVHEGWREHRGDGGVVISVQDNAVVCRGLSMPHSPRWHNGRLWLLNSGTGEIGWVNLAVGRFEPVAFCPGYLRGLGFIGDYAVVGLSKPRENRTFTGLPLDDKLREKNVAPRCALQIIDLNRGDIQHEVRIEGMIEELYDVIAFNGVRNPMAYGFVSDEIRHVVSLPPESLNS
jgi:uncharacterized protein (TIGR03032 family)